MNFLICKICEAEIDAEKLLNHSSKCKEFYSLKEDYNNLKTNLLKLIHRSNEIKNDLTTSAVIQKNKLKKTFIRSQSHEFETQPAQKVKETPSLTTDDTSTGLAIEEQTDQVAGSIVLKDEEDKKISEVQYRKIFVEYDKTIYALKKIIVYGEKLTSNCYNNFKVEAVDLEIKTDLELIYTEINDAVISELLVNVVDSLSEMIEKKRSIKKVQDELKFIEEPTKKGPRLLTKSSMSFKTKNIVKSVEFLEDPKIKHKKSDLSTIKEDGPDSKSALGSSQITTHNEIEEKKPEVNTIDRLPSISVTSQLSKELSDSSDEFKDLDPNSRKMKIPVNLMPVYSKSVQHKSKAEETPTVSPSHMKRSASLDNIKVKDFMQPQIFLRTKSIVRDKSSDEIKSSADSVNLAKKKSIKKLIFTEDWDTEYMRGYHSDSDVKPLFLESSDISPEVSMDDFEFIKMLGKGAFGKVWLVRKKATGDLYAMKIIDSKDQAKTKFPMLKAERDIFEILQGNHVVRAIWTFHYQNNICFVMEYMIGGDLNSILMTYGYFEEEIARFYFAELLLAVESLHKLSIVHRDLKPDNMLLDSRGHLKLADFGLSEIGIESKIHSKKKIEEINNTKKLQNIKEVRRNSVAVGQVELLFRKPQSSKKEEIFKFLDKNLSRKSFTFQRAGSKEGKAVEIPEKKVRMIGTPDYMAPEIILGKDCNSKTVDYWSLGVILYEFFTGIPPFNANTVEQVYENIKSNYIEWPPVGYDEGCIPPAAMDLIKCLLNPNPSKRLGSKKGVEEIKAHPFFKDFDWDDLYSKDGYILPSISPTKIKKSGSIAPFKRSDDTDQRESNQRKTFNFENFRLKRLDILDQMNREEYEKYLKH